MNGEDFTDLGRPLAATILGHTVSIEWRPSDDNWRASWWLTVDGQSPFPIGAMDANHHDVLTEAVEKYIGHPPPDDHAKIWGEYKCTGCGASHVRLWRDYNTVLDGQALRCRPCAIEHAEKPAEYVFRGDQIGWMVPAVPTPDGSTFWGYSSVPMAALDWWKALPVTRETRKTTTIAVKS